MFHRLLKKHPSPATATWMLLTISLLPLLLCSPLPLGDYANHLARMHIIAALPTSDDLARYYEINWAVIPNLAADLLVPPLGKLIGIEPSQLLFTALALALIATGTLALHRQLHGKSSYWPLLVFLLLYNRQFLWGFLNYLFAVGAMLWLLTWWLRFRDRPGMPRAVLFTLPTTLLFFCHLHPLAAYGICVASIELSRWRSHHGSFGKKAIVASSAFVQFIPSALLLVFASPTSDRAGDIAFGSISNKVSGLLDAFNNYNLPLDGITAALFFGAIGLGVLTGRLKFHRDLQAAVLVLGLCYCLMPNVLFSSFGADRRILIAALIVAIAALDVTAKLGVRQIQVAAVLGLSLFAIRTLVIAVNWHAAQAVYDRHAEAFKLISPGSRVACLVAEPLEPFLRNPPLDHFCNLAIIERNVFTNALFAEPGKQILRVRYNEDTPFNRSESQEYRFPTASRESGPVRGVLTKLPLDRFDWVLIYHDRFFGDPRPPGLTLAWRNEAEDASLYRVKHD